MQILHTGVLCGLQGVMPDVLLDGLPVIDLLEITPSTDAVARFTQRDQSSVSRIYRQVSLRLGLGFRKRADGGYQAQTNQTLLEQLRCASQTLRLQADPPQPRWILCGGNHPTIQQIDPPPLPASLHPRDCAEANLTALLQRRLVDLVLQLAPAADAASAVVTEASRPPELLRRRLGSAQVLLRRDLQGSPGLSRLLADLESRLHA